MNIDNFKEKLGDRFSRDADFLNLLVDMLNLPKDSKVLDVGTGRGVMAITLALHGYRVTTGEPEGTFWADWRTSAQKVNVDELIEFKSLNAEDLLFRDNEFDAIFLYTTFHHISDKKRAFNELTRVLKPKGQLAIIELTNDGVKEVRKTFRGHPDAVDPRNYQTDPNIRVNVKESKYLNAYIYTKD